MTLLTSGLLVSAQTAPDASAASTAVQPIPPPDITFSPTAELPTIPGTDDRFPRATDSQPIDKRIFGVLPNYGTTSGTAPFMPITAKQKFTIAAKDTFDYPVYGIAAGFAGLYQMENQNPSYGQGLKGYAKRFGAAYGDQAASDLLAEGLIPTLMHQDPRYFRLGPGRGKWYRAGYALRGVMVAKSDRGNWMFNAGEWAGNAAAVAISNLYYPDDARNAPDNTEKLLVQVATDAFTNVLREFWPDIKQKYSHKKQPAGN